MVFGLWALLLTVCCLLLAVCSAAHAHITLENQQAPAGSFYKAVLRVSHGCNGSATVKLRVHIAEGVTSVKMQPKPGWKAATVKGKLTVPLDDGHGNKITEVIREATWSAGRLLDENWRIQINAHISDFDKATFTADLRIR